MTDEEFNALHEVEFSVGKPECFWDGTVKGFNERHGTRARTHKEIKETLSKLFGMGGLFEGQAAIRVTTKSTPKKMCVVPYDVKFWEIPSYRQIVYRSVEEEFKSLQAMQE